MNVKKLSIFLFVAALLFFGIAKTSFAAYHFDPAVFYYENHSPSSITTGDFNLDGKLDFVVTNGSSHTVSVFLASSTAAGLFNAAIDYPEGTSQAGPYGITSGDFNGDSILDLAVTNQGGDHISVILGSSTATGTFQTAVSYSVAGSPIGITTGDFDLDGVLDLAVDNYGTSTVSVLLGSSTATGTFQTAVNYPSGVANSETIVTGDFNNDGVLDLALNNYYSDRIELLLGSSTATGTFQTAVNYSAGSGPRGITVGDFNGDGISDLAVANQNSNNISILPASTTYSGGTFYVSTQYLVGTRPKGITSGDFNGDGVTDIAIANQNDNNVSVSLNSFNVPGTFNNFPTNYSVVDPNVTCSEGTNPYDLTSADFNGDGIPDLAAVNINCDSIAILLSRPEKFWVGGTGNWSDATNHWATSTGGLPNASNIPISSDDVTFDQNSTSVNGDYTVTMDTSATVHNFTMAGPGPSGGVLTWAGSYPITIYGSLSLSNTPNPITNNYTGNIVFGATSGTSTITSNGNSFLSNFTFNGVGGTWKLSDNFHTYASVILTSGTFDANNFDVTAHRFESDNANTRSLNMGSGTWILNGTGYVWDIEDPTNLTLNSGSSTISITDTDCCVSKYFAGGSKIYNVVTFSGDDITISGNNTFDAMNVDNAGSLTGLFFTPNSTQTVTNFNTNGSSGSLAVIQSVDGITPFNLLKSGGTVSVDYMYILASAATGTVTWYAGANSNNAGFNTGWIFTAPPSTTTAHRGRRITSSSTTELLGTSTETLSSSTTPTPEANSTSTTTLATNIPYQFSFTKILKLGSTGDEVKQLQIFLNTHGFPLAKTGVGSKGHETNYFGLKTKQALIKFQEANVKDILKPQNLTKGTGIFWIFSKKFVNEILLGGK